ncbi:MAG: cytochrome c biogenesis protein CcdA [Patescibacteria group bacterium]
MDLNIGFIISAFIAGVLTFVAPCTLPLVPGYLGFISGVSLKDLRDPAKSAGAKRKIFLSGLLFVLGFSAVFIFFGSLFGLGGVAFAKYRILLQQVGGAVVTLFGLYMIGLLKLPALSFLESEHHFSLGRYLKPGQPVSSLIFGMTFAVGWTPCVGPILGSILTLAASSATVGTGALLLAVFSVGLGLPFLVIAATIGSASRALQKLDRLMHGISIVGGVFLVFLGFLLLTNGFSAWVGWFYQLFNFINYDALLDYL